MNRSGAAQPGERPTGGGVLYVVATPIGNLSDVTLRALQVLGDVPLIAAEDTRLTKRLLDRHGLTARLTSFHAKSGPGRLATLLDHLRSGSDLALVTDAGTPVVSDPGEDLVSAWSDEGGRVVPIPGASAVLAAVTASGLAGPRWSFEGFLPRSGRTRRDHLERIAADTRGCVLFEAPNRVAGTLDDLAVACGPERSGAVCRELTKIHEQIVRAPLRELAAATADGRIPSRGEFVIVVGGIKGGSPGAALPRPPGHAASDTEQLSSALEAVERLVAAGTARGEAARRVAAETGIPRRRLYRAQG